MKKEEVTKYYTKRLFEILNKNSWAILDSTFDKVTEGEVVREIIDLLNDTPNEAEIPVAVKYEIRGLSDTWTVNKFIDGSYSCGCPLFTDRLHGNKPCHHIVQASLRIANVKAKIDVRPNISVPTLDYATNTLYLKKDYLSDVHFRYFTLNYLDSSYADQIVLLIKGGWSLADISETYQIQILNSTEFLHKVLNMTNFADAQYKYQELETKLESRW